MSESTHTPGPWVAWHESNKLGEIVQAGVDTEHRAANIASIETSNVECENANGRILADVRLIAAAPAFAAAWTLVPDEIKGRIFDALHTPNTEWVEAAIGKATGTN